MAKYNITDYKNRFDCPIGVTPLTRKQVEQIKKQHQQKENKKDKK